jgi:hypothetical protein
VSSIRCKGCQTISTSSSTNSFDQYLTTKAEILSLKEELTALTSEIQQAQQHLVLLLLTCPSDLQQNNQIQVIGNVINNNTQRIITIVSDSPFFCIERWQNRWPCSKGNL